MNCDLAFSRFLHPPESAGLCTRPRHCPCAQEGHCPDGQAGSASAVREAEGVSFVLRSKPRSLLQLPQTALPRHQRFIDTPPPINNADSLISTWPFLCVCTTLKGEVQPFPLHTASPWRDTEIGMVVSPGMGFGLLNFH